MITMERLTNKREADAQRKEYENRISNGYPRNIPEERFLRLAAYEDTGLTPEEIAKIREESEEGCIRAVARTFGVDTRRLRELAAADRLGRAVVLPCNVGDTVYATFGHKVEERRVIEFDVVTCKSSGPVVHAALAADQQVTMSVRWDLVVDKTVFLTRKDAEAALKGEENGRG